MPKQVVNLESAVEENLRLRALVQELLQSGLGTPIPGSFTVDPGGMGKFSATFTCQSPERFGYREPSAKLGTRPIVCGKRGGQLFELDKGSLSLIAKQYGFHEPEIIFVGTINARERLTAANIRR
jgi:hypothetical protein